MGKAWTTVRNSVEQLDENVDPNTILQQTLTELFKEVKDCDVNKLQNRLTKKVEKTIAEEYDRERNPTERARVRAASSYGAKAAFLAVPTSGDLSLHPEAMAFAVQYRVGTSASTAHVSMCACGERLPQATHILSCKHLRGRFVRHDVLVSLLAKMCTEAGLVATTEVMVVEGRQKRMDLVITLPTGRVWIDVSVVNPQAPSYVKDTNPKRTREQAKTAKWQLEAKKKWVQFIPFVVDTFGGLGKQAKDWLGKVAVEGARRKAAYISTSIEHYIGRYKWGLVERIGVAVAHANYCMVQEASIKSEFPKARTGMLYAPVWNRAGGDFVRGMNKKKRYFMPRGM